MNTSKRLALHLDSLRRDPDFQERVYPSAAKHLPPVPSCRKADDTAALWTPPCIRC